MLSSPYVMGLLDAIEQGGYLSMGMTWSDDQDANEAYDRGANMGELLMVPVNYVLGALRTVLDGLSRVSLTYWP